MKKHRAGLLFVILLLFASLFFAYSASALESTCPSGVITAGTVGRGDSEVSVYSDTNKTGVLGKLKKGAACQIVGAVGKFYRVIFEGKTGYVFQSKLSPTGIRT